jgi:hypothetical protein
MEELVSAARYRAADNFNLNPLIEAAPFEINL